MKFEIKSWITGRVLFSIGTETLKLAVEAAAKSGATLGGADLCDANLCGANLRSAYLRRANLGGADLRDADLRGADLRDADLGGADLRSANLRSANLSDADLCDADLYGADLGGANLRDANLRDANLRGAQIDGVEIPTDEAALPLLRQVSKAALAAPECLYMGAWHICETSHCIAGWAVQLAGDRGKELESKYGCANAGLLLLGPEAATHFYDDDASARKWLKSKVAG